MHGVFLQRLKPVADEPIVMADELYYLKSTYLVCLWRQTVPPSLAAMARDVHDS